MGRAERVRCESRLLPALLLFLAGCASIPETVHELPAADAAIELGQTPFFPQQRFQCGPAALTTALATSGVAVELQHTVDKVYLPGRHGSLRPELMAATRTEGRLPYVIDGSLGAIWQELAAGRPVVVLQNLGIAAIPRWHYAVVVGIDPVRSEVFLRSGTDRRRVTPVQIFLRTWRRGEYWGMVVLRPDELPASVDRRRYLGAVAALQQAGRLHEAALAWRTALGLWPQDAVALFGLGNVQFARGEFEAAEASYRDLLRVDPGMVAARNNLALTLAEQQKFDTAVEEIGIALNQNSDPALESELSDTESFIKRMRRGDE